MYICKVGNKIKLKSEIKYCCPQTLHLHLTLLMLHPMHGPIPFSWLHHGKDNLLEFVAQLCDGILSCY